MNNLDLIPQYDGETILALRDHLQMSRAGLCNAVAHVEP